MVHKSRADEKPAKLEQARAKTKELNVAGCELMEQLHKTLLEVTTTNRLLAELWLEMLEKFKKAQKNKKDEAEAHEMVKKARKDLEEAKNKELSEEEMRKKSWDDVNEEEIMMSLSAGINPESEVVKEVEMEDADSSSSSASSETASSSSSSSSSLSSLSSSFTEPPHPPSTPVATDTKLVGVGNRPLSAFCYYDDLTMDMIKSKHFLKPNDGRLVNYDTGEPVVDPRTKKLVELTGVIPRPNYRDNLGYKHKYYRIKQNAEGTCHIPTKGVPLALLSNTNRNYNLLSVKKDKQNPDSTYTDVTMDPTDNSPHKCFDGSRVTRYEEIVIGLSLFGERSQKISANENGEFVVPALTPPPRRFPGEDSDE